LYVSSTIHGNVRKYTNCGLYKGELNSYGHTIEAITQKQGSMLHGILPFVAGWTNYIIIKKDMCELMTIYLRKERGDA